MLLFDNLAHTTYILPERSYDEEYIIHHKSSQKSVESIPTTNYQTGRKGQLLLKQSRMNEYMNGLMNE